MASDNDKPQETSLPSASTVSGNETSRARSIATRLTDTEFGEVEAAAADAGKKVAERKAHNELQSRGLVSKQEHSVRTLVPRQEMTDADRSWAQQYQVNDILRYSRSSKETASRRATIPTSLL